MQEFFGIDVGGTAVKWAVLGEDFSIRERGSLSTGFTTAEETVSALIGFVEPYRERVSAVGVSAPGGIYEGDVTGTIHRGGIVLDGKVLRGAHCFAGEFSFLRNDVATAANMGNSFADSGGWRALRDAAVAEKGLPAGSPVDGRRVFEWIADGDKAAQRALDRYARAFDGQLINLQAVLDPEVFVIAGGISCHPELVDALRAQMPLALAGYEGTLAGIPVPQIKVAELGNDANLYGAVQEAIRLV